MKITKQFFEDSRAYMWKERFAVVRNPSELPKEYFCVIKDKAETTLIVDEKNLPEKFDKKEGGYRIITFDATIPFELVGFTARVSGAMSEEGVSILSIAAYSTDHFLVKNSDLPKAKKALEKIGVKIYEIK